MMILIDYLIKQNLLTRKIIANVFLVNFLNSVIENVLVPLIDFIFSKCNINKLMKITIKEKEDKNNCCEDEIAFKFGPIFKKLTALILVITVIHITFLF